jgi:hypothetical protein
MAVSHIAWRLIGIRIDRPRADCLSGESALNAFHHLVTTPRSQLLSLRRSIPSDPTHRAAGQARWLPHGKVSWILDLPAGTAS